MALNNNTRKCSHQSPRGNSMMVLFTLLAILFSVSYGVMNPPKGENVCTDVISQANDQEALKLAQ